jgi:hypothetical protein
MTRLGAIRAFLLNSRGAVAIEFAAIALPLMLLLGGSVEISRYVWTRLALQDAASTGARCVGLRLEPCFVAGNMDTSGTVSLVQEQAAAWAIDIPDESVTPEATVAAKRPARASLRYAKAPLTPRYRRELHQLWGHCYQRGSLLSCRAFGIGVTRWVAARVNDRNAMPQKEPARCRSVLSAKLAPPTARGQQGPWIVGGCSFLPDWKVSDE